MAYWQQLDGNCDWITLGSVAGSSSPYTYTYGVAENTSGSTREGYLHITVGTMTAIVKIEQKNHSELIKEMDGDANCFIVAPGSTISFSFKSSYYLEYCPYRCSFYNRKLWDDTGAMAHAFAVGTGSNAMVVVNTTQTPGNAVIAAKVNGENVWSYHIWVVDYDPEIKYWNGRNGYIVMDRNLGSGLGTGLFYQWGRKDPIPAVDAVAEGEWKIITKSSLGTVTTLTGIQNPNALISAS